MKLIRRRNENHWTEHERAGRAAVLGRGVSAGVGHCGKPAITVAETRPSAGRLPRSSGRRRRLDLLPRRLTRQRHRNNIFACSATHALWPYSERRPSTFRQNVVYLTQGEWFIPYGERSLNERLAAKESLGEWDQNLRGDRVGSVYERAMRRKSMAPFRDKSVVVHAEQSIEHDAIPWP